jgi:GNAT superfamily N-acetyltransferase
MAAADFEIRRADARDAAAIASAHRDSIRSIGPAFYAPDLVEAWGSALTPELYANAMAGGEAFFVAVGRIDGEVVVLGFSTHRVDDGQDGVSVYVRGSAARRGIGTALLRAAEEHARVSGATSIEIQASRAGVAFYGVNGFTETGRGDAVLRSGRRLPCVFMRKALAI